jgi:isoleucyl-tRNA synthetase
MCSVVEGMSDFYKEIIEDELNVKNVVFTSDVRNFTSYTFKPQLKTLGRRFGSKLNALKEVLSSLNGNEAMDELNEKGTLTITLDGTEEVLEKDDLLIDAAQMEGYVTDSDYGITVVLDTNLTEELIEEGFVREVISKIQTMRKDAGFEVMDHIVASVKGNEKVEAIVKKNVAEISSIVLADDVVYGEAQGFSKEWNLNGEDVTLGVMKVNA